MIVRRLSSLPDLLLISRDFAIVWYIGNALSSKVRLRHSQLEQRSVQGRYTIYAVKSGRSSLVARARNSEEQIPLMGGAYVTLSFRQSVNILSFSNVVDDHAIWENKNDPPSDPPYFLRPITILLNLRILLGSLI